MEYKKVKGIILTQDDKVAQVCLTRPDKQHQSNSCSGCGLCASQTSAMKYKVKLGEGADVKKGDLVDLMIPQVSFALASFLVFVLPLILMILFPVISVQIGKGIDNAFLQSMGAIIPLGILGFLLAILINFVINKKVFKKYPPYIDKENT
jgi:positive regulator of sigma E activity